VKVKDHFSTREIQSFCARSDLQAWLAIATTWAIIGVAFFLVAFWPNLLTVLVALIILGGHQLGLGVLMHECGHGTLFKSKSMNRLIGTWLWGAPVMYRLDDYMSNHLSHHAKAGSEADPDLYRYQHYPVSAKSLRRKLLRDISGQTALNFLRTSFARNHIIKSNDQGGRGIDWCQLWSRLHGPIVANSILLLVLSLLGAGYLYLLWLAVYFSFYIFFSRIRNLAEHACVQNIFDPDPMLHTRTTLASWWERLTFAPNSVNYHLEHPLLPSVPKYRLAQFHQALKRKGLLDLAEIATGYVAVTRRFITQVA
jgi:fatty acid desaturase